MLSGMMIVWFSLLACSLIFCIVDLPQQPIMTTQKLGWFLVILYTGVVGLVLYLLSCRSPGDNLHDIYIKPLWKQAVNSEVHCVAGDATGIILAAIVLSFFSIATSTEVTLEYIAAFLFGWFIFQAGMMRNMYASYQQALTKTFFSEAVSMNCIMIGMIPTMVLLTPLMPHSMDPLHPEFWFKMSLATLVGWIFGYPANYLLVKFKLKHGCMTKPSDEAINQEAHQHTHHHSMNTLSPALQISYIALTFILMLLVIFWVLYFHS